MESSQNLPSSDAKNYPRNVFDRTYAPHLLDIITHQLNTQAPRLLADEAHAALDLLDLRHDAKDFWSTRFQNAKGLREHLWPSPSTSGDVHLCRFLFIHAAHSREKLKISREMLVLCLTYFQVMPEFLAFLYPFGFQKYPQADFNFSGFRQRLFLASHTQSPSKYRALPIGTFQICYNFKSVEPSDSRDWSIRHCAIYHSFNLKEVRARWIIVKGDGLMRRRIEAATGDGSLQGASDFTAIDRAFRASLDTHMIFCDWSAENWRWYVNYLEDGFQNMTRMTLAAPVEKMPLASPDTGQFSFGPRTNTMETQRSKFSALSRRQTQASEKNILDSVRSNQSAVARTYTNPETGISQPLPPEEDDDDEEEMGNPSVPGDGVKAAGENPKFSFGKLRKIHRIAEKANETVLVLGQNQMILTQLSECYRSILNRKEFPTELLENCKDAVEDFEHRIKGLVNDLQMQILRLESLLRLLGERKTLLHSILDYQNTQANKYSTKSMVTMTEDMDDIARKTKIETVSMKVITLVTLFFLPGTFISVGRIFLSTLMSTEIFQSEDTGSSEPNPYARLNPVQIYLALSLPLTVVTLLFWAGFHFWEMRHENRKMHNHRASGWQA